MYEVNDKGLTIPTVTAQKDLEEDLSDNLVIDLDSSAIESRKNTLDISRSFTAMNDENIDIMKVLRDDIAKKLDDKAKQVPLTINTVKNIIKQVLTYDNIKDYIANEPRLTRAKAKKIFSYATVPPLPVSLISKLPSSETNVLIGEDLKDDDSGEEYVPGEESGEDDISNESSIPVKSSISNPQTSNLITEIVGTAEKLSSIKESKEDPDEGPANIALRTRSKINLSSTPLEEIEKSFIPPDITRDMYDTECDDVIWQDFLKGFFVPLDEVAKPIEDEQDPEYNIVTDDELNQIDNEDFCIENAVQITKKEIEELWDELLEYVTLPDLSGDQAPALDENKCEEAPPQLNERHVIENQTAADYITIFSKEINMKSEMINNSTNGQNQISKDKEAESSRHNAEISHINNSISISTKNESDDKVKLDERQTLIFQQQMRQHVQMLTQNFLLTYEHPELHDMSCQMNEYLLNLKYLCGEDLTSFYKPINLEPALELINKWIELFKTNSNEVKTAKKHVEKQLSLTASYSMAGNSTYIPTFSSLLLKIISESVVFMYPFLLPKIPFKSRQCFHRKYGFTNAEDSLLVFAINEFKKYLENNSNKSPTYNTIIQYVQEYVMPHRDAKNILKHMYYTKLQKCGGDDSIQQRVNNNNNGIAPVVHYLYPPNDIIAPAYRLPHQLPYQWKTFLFPEVGMIFGIIGACKIEELYYLKIEDIDERDDELIIVTIPTKRSFVVINELNAKVQYLNIFYKYRNLRPCAPSLTSRFFLNYRNGKCTHQVIGRSTIGSWPSNIAEYLKLENPSTYTGHSFRMSSNIFSRNKCKSFLAFREEEGNESSITSEEYLENFIDCNKTFTNGGLGKNKKENISCINVDNDNEINTTDRETECLLPMKSKNRYVGSYNSFKNWCMEKCKMEINENSLLEYFMKMKNENLKAASSLWAEYSMLKSTILIKDSINISKYKELKNFLKKINVGYHSKKASAFTKDEFIKFLLEASDENFLVHKVGMILGIAGACRTDQLYNLKIENIENHNGLIIVNVPLTAQDQRSFVIINDSNEKVRYLDIFYKYQQLRPRNATCSHFFLNYRNGECRNQVIGRGTIGRWPSRIAEFLKLKNPNNYTGHSFRRSAAILSIEKWQKNRIFNKMKKCNNSCRSEEQCFDSISKIVKIEDNSFDNAMDQVNPEDKNEILIVPVTDTGLTVTTRTISSIVATPAAIKRKNYKTHRTKAAAAAIEQKKHQQQQPISESKNKLSSLYVGKEQINPSNKKKCGGIENNLNKTAIEQFISIFAKPLRVGSLLHLFAEPFYVNSYDDRRTIEEIKVNEMSNLSSSNMINEICFSQTNGIPLQKDGGDEYLISMQPVTQKSTTTKKEPSGAEKKKTKLRKEFVANLSIATPEKSDIEKLQNEKFAIAYYNKLRETLALNDYNKVMQILIDFNSGDVVDLYRDIESILEDKHPDLLEEFLYFLKAKEAAILNKLMPWLEVQMRSKFCRKLELYFKDQPTQLKRIYNSLLELSQTEDISMEKIKTTLLPMFKGNSILTNLFLQNFKDEQPPSNLLEGPYEIIDVNKELSREKTDEEMIHEKFIISNTEIDKYGGSNCICHCHNNLEDNDFKGRYKHCNSCGLRFIQGKVYVQTGRCPYPATVSFQTNPNVDHSSRLIGKTAAAVVSGFRRKRCEISPSKQNQNNSNASGKENNDEDTDDEEACKRRKIKGKSKKTKSTITKKIRDNLKGTPKTRRRRRTSTCKKNKKDLNDCKKSEAVLTKNADDHQIENIKIYAESDTVQNLNKIKLEMHEEIGNTHYRNIEHEPLEIKIEDIKSEQEIFSDESSSHSEHIESEISNPDVEGLLDESQINNFEEEEEEEKEEQTPWIRQEDMIILETFQKENNKEIALQKICDRLPDRSKSEINNRFAKLMSLLLETIKQS